MLKTNLEIKNKIKIKNNPFMIIRDTEEIVKDLFKSNKNIKINKATTSWINKIPIVTFPYKESRSFLSESNFITITVELNANATPK